MVHQQRRVPIALMLGVLCGVDQTESVSLRYASSGNLTRDYSESVSYYSRAFYERPPEPAH